MTYILIIMLAGSGYAVGTAEFKSKDACEVASKAVLEKRREYQAGATLNVCVPKG